MSVKAMTWAWDQDLKPTHKLILMRLADYADAQGRVDYCSYKQLTDDVNVSKATIVDKLKELKAWEYITSHRNQRGDGGHGKNSYVLNMFLPDVVYPIPETDQGACSKSDQALVGLPDQGLGQLSDHAKKLTSKHTFNNPHSPHEDAGDFGEGNQVVDERPFKEKLAELRGGYEVPISAGRVAVAANWKVDADAVTVLAEFFNVDTVTITLEAQAFAEYYSTPKKGKKYKVYSPMATFIDWIAKRHQKKELDAKTWEFNPALVEDWRRVLGPVRGQTGRLTFMSGHLRFNWVFKMIGAYKVGSNPWDRFNAAIPPIIHAEYGEAWGWIPDPITTEGASA